jgi:hypothetical protein
MSTDPRTAAQCPPVGRDSPARDSGHWPAGLVGLGGIALVASGVVVWSFVGKLQTKVAGPCMLLSSEGVVDVKAGAGGRFPRFRFALARRCERAT